MKTFTFLLLLLSFCYHTVAQDTFSIIAADPATGEVGAAGATCVDGIAQFGGIQLLNKIIPGKGGVNAQAWVCLNPHINLDNAIEQMENGLSPQEIIDWLIANDECAAQNFNPEYRQYGVVDFDDNMEVRTAAFTGANADDYKNHITGPTYAIQGNILLGPEVLEGMENGFTLTDGTLAERLMAAMQGANIPGADARCLDRGTSSTSAFLRVYKPDDELGNPWMELNVLEMPFGEEPIDSLQTLFDEFQLSSVFENSDKNEVHIFPNPVDDILQINADEVNDIESVSIYTITGKMVTESAFTNITIDVSNLEKGVYLVYFENKEGIMKMGRFVKN